MGLQKLSTKLIISFHVIWYANSNAWYSTNNCRYISFINLWFWFLTILVSCLFSHSIYFSKKRNDSIFGPKSINLVTLNITQLTLIHLRGSNNTDSYKVSICLYFTLYKASCNIVSEFKFILTFRSKCEFNDVGVELDNGSCMTDWKNSCTSKWKCNL